MSDIDSTASLAVPADLAAAYADDELVFFCGAGISVPAPSSLPNFRKLTQNIVDLVGRDDVVNEATQLDLLLGDIDRQGARVHRLVEEQIAQATKPNELHQYLVELATRRTPRIITTNFDRLLEAAAAEMDLDIPVYVAPALPQGDNFSGVVHLHGAVPNTSAEALVVTDTDFGLAYITRGWATDFLARVFDRYAVLFVGYSAGDPLLRYFARSVPPSKKLFALSPPSISQEAWTSIGVTPLYYSNEDGSHSEVAQVLGTWSARGRGTSAERYDKIAAIAVAPPPTDEADSVELSWMLRTPEYQSHFLGLADVGIWLSWLEEDGLLDSLFLSSNDDQNTLASWVATSIQSDGGESLARICASRGGQIGPILWFHIWYAIQADFVPSPASRALVEMLIFAPSVEPGRTTMLVEQLAEGDSKLAEFVVRRLFQTRARVEYRDRGLGGSTPKISFSPQIDADLFERAWVVLQPLLGEPARLLDSALSLIADTEADEALANSSGRDSYVSRMRSTVADESDRGRSKDWDPVIIVARDLLREHTRAMGRERPIALLTRESITLRRLGLDALSASPGIEPDAILNTLIDLRLLFDSDVKPEAFAALASAFPFASDRAKDELVDHIAHFEDDEVHVRDYERYNLAVWLAQKAPDDPIAKAALAQLRQRFPNFEPRERPDRNWWTSEFTQHPSYEPVGKYGGLSPIECLTRLTLDLGDRNPWDAEEPLAEFRLYLLESDARPVEMARVLAEAPQTPWEIWSVTIARLPADRLPEWAPIVLRGLGGHPELEHLANDLYFLVVGEDKVQALRDAQRRLSLAISLWRTTPVPTEGDSDEEASIIGSVRARLAMATFELLIRSVNLRRDRRLTERDEQRLDEVLRAGSSSGDPTAAIAFMNAYALAELAPAKFEAMMIPLLAPNEPTAPMAWSGLLRGSYWGTTMRGLLEPIFRTRFAWVREHLPGSIERYSNHHAYLYATQEDPASIEWADPFYLAASDTERASWLRDLGAVAERSGSQEVWSRLDLYWTRRLRGLPGDITPNEQSALFRWLQDCGDYFSVAALKFAEGPAIAFSDSGHFFANPSDLPSEDPSALGKVMWRIVTSSDRLPYFVRSIFDHCSTLKVTDPALARSLAEELLRRNYTPSRALIDELDSLST